MSAARPPQGPHPGSGTGPHPPGSGTGPHPPGSVQSSSSPDSGGPAGGGRPGAAGSPGGPHPPGSDDWSALRACTPARIGLGRAGPAWPTREVLRFGLAHARARDAVHHPLDAAGLAQGLAADGHPALRARSAAPDRATYLVRPDLGRRLDAASAAALAASGVRAELVVVVADGLSAVAVERHARPLLAALRAGAPARWAGVPVVVAEQARVALGDAVGAALGARLAAVLIGERPGLSSPDSLGVYLTYAPRPGATDVDRNCLSNVRPEGLAYAEAAFRLDWLAGEALRRGLSGVELKDDSAAGLLPGAAGPAALAERGRPV